MDQCTLGQIYFENIYLYCSDYRTKLKTWLKKHDAEKDIFEYNWSKTNENKCSPYCDLTDSFETENPQMTTDDTQKLLQLNLHIFNVDIEDHGREQVVFWGRNRQAAKEKLIKWLYSEPFVTTKDLY